MVLIIITAVMEVSVIIISCILYHCICNILGRERQKWILLDRDRRMKWYNRLFFFGICKCLYSFKMSCHLSFNR